MTPAQYEGPRPQNIVKLTNLTTSREPEIHVIKPEVNLITPEVNVIKPEFDVITPEVKVIKPEMDVITPEVNVITPEVALKVEKEHQGHEGKDDKSTLGPRVLASRDLSQETQDALGPFNKVTNVPEVVVPPGTRFQSPSRVALVPSPGSSARIRPHTHADASQSAPLHAGHGTSPQSNLSAAVDKNRTRSRPRQQTVEPLTGTQTNATVKQYRKAHLEVQHKERSVDMNVDTGNNLHVQPANGPADIYALVDKRRNNPAVSHKPGSQRTKLTAPSKCVELIKERAHERVCDVDWSGEHDEKVRDTKL